MNLLEGPDYGHSVICYDGKVITKKKTGEEKSSQLRFEPVSFATIVREATYHLRYHSSLVNLE